MSHDKYKITAIALDTTPQKRWKCVEPVDKPYASFLFQHRPAALLQAMGIMPRPPPVEANENFVRREHRSKSNVAAKRTSRGDEDLRARKRSRPSLGGQSGSESEEDIKPNIEDPEETARISSLQENIRRMQAELESLTKSTSGRVKSERAPSPIFVGSAAGTVIDLTAD
ncbi:hypothetical protein DENSPDRAFT_682330 [Dentipellis sp. KUC8613]|nr:hypothetical protein DENSPDRAFT_682330 [Dentipellis sp. KUC8613]